MKVLKGYIRQKARLEGSMVEEWLMQESMFYILEFLGQINPLIPRICEESNDELQER